MEGAASELVGLAGFEPVCHPVMSGALLPIKLEANFAGKAGFEPATARLTAGSTTAVLLANLERIEIIEISQHGFEGQ